MEKQNAEKKKKKKKEKREKMKKNGEKMKDEKTKCRRQGHSRRKKTLPATLRFHYVWPQVKPQ